MAVRLGLAKWAPKRSLRADMRRTMEECARPNTSFSGSMEKRRRRVLRLFLGVFLGIEEQDPEFPIALYQKNTRVEWGALLGMVNRLFLFCIEGPPPKSPALFASMDDLLMTSCGIQTTGVLRVCGRRMCTFRVEAAAEALARCPLSQ
jgi:hypothetical protein